MTRVERHVVQDWLEDLTTLWQNRDVEGALALFDNCSVYLETPFSINAALEPGGISRLWSEVHNQTDVRVSTAILVIDESAAACSYEARMNINGTPHHSSGIWVIHFADGQCVEFRQWFMIDPGV